MQIVEFLSQEHRKIDQLIEALLEWAAAAAAGDPDAPADCADFVRWFQEFADHHHHGKEEELLFVALLDAGLPRQSGPVAVMLHEHDLGRAAIASLAACAADERRPWPESTRRQALEAAEAFADVLRPHILKEEGVLFPMAEQRLSAEAAQQVDDRTLAFERVHADRAAEMAEIFERLDGCWSPA